MAQTGKYKETERGERQLVSEENFASGMFGGESPLGEGFCKTVVNFAAGDRSDKLVPRRGLHITRSVALFTLPTEVFT